MFKYLVAAIIVVTVGLAGLGVIGSRNKILPELSQPPEKKPALTTADAQGKSGGNFSRTGNLTKPGDEWTLVYEKPGSPAISAILRFDEASMCPSETGQTPCNPAIFSAGDRVTVDGDDVDGVVMVRTLSKAGAKDAKPTPETEISSFIRTALAKKYNKAEDAVQITVDKNDDRHAKGMVSFSDEPGGGVWFAVLDQGEWIPVFDGNGIMDCVTKTLYEFPAEMVPKCVKSD